MVAKCPSMDEENNLAALCERVTIPDQSYSHLMDIPVLSLETNRTYVNIFCAQCHADVNRLANWDISIECNNPELISQLIRSPI